ncbi:MAG: hypothetical protein ACR2H5_12445 [Ktedonobacteraceae bacterium]
MQQMNLSIKKNLSAIFTVTMLFGVLVLLIGMYLLTYMNYHERAYTTLGLGVVSFIGGLAGLIVSSPRVKTALCYAVIALGMVAFPVAGKYLTYPWASYHERAYLIMGIGVLCLLGGIAAAITLHPKAIKITCYSILALGIVTSLGVISLIIGIDQLLVFEATKKASVLLGAGGICLLSGIAAAIIVQRRSWKILS